MIFHISVWADYVREMNPPLFSPETCPICTIDKNGKIITCEQFISQEPISLSFSAYPIGDILIGKNTYVVKIGRFEHWEEEPGDFDIIQFYKDNKLMLTYKDADGIVKLNDSKNPYAYSFYRYSENGYFMEAKLSDSTKILVFIGQHYGTDLAKLIVFAATSEDIKLVYNQKVAINSMIKTDDRFALLVQSNIPDEGEEPILHTIEIVEGVLKFGDSQL